jgi:effector-binding domain-containing protein
MDSEPEIIQLRAGPAISIRAQISLAELPTFFASAFGELAARGAAQIAGSPFAIYHAFDPARIDVEAVMPVRDAIAPIGRAQPRSLPGGPAVQVRHMGPYEDVASSYTTIERWIADHHRSKAGAVREVYLTEPSVPWAEHVTLVIQPIAA